MLSFFKSNTFRAQLKKLKHSIHAMTKRIKEKKKVTFYLKKKKLKMLSFTLIYI